MAKSKKKSTQNVENVSGRVIQAGGNVTVNEKSSKTVGEKIAIWVGIAVGLVTIITAIIKFQGSVTTSARFLGLVVDQNNQGVEAATVFTLSMLHGDTLGFGQTDARGEFSFTVKSKPESSVYILIEKDGKTQQHGFETLAGNKRLTLK